MPYSVHKRGSKWCVIKDTDGSTIACHPTKTAAQRQVRALYANENKAFVFKAHGLRYMFLMSSNAYRDREKDILREKALRRYVREFEPNDYLFWHGGEPIGEIVAAKMAGPFLLEIAKELPNETIDLQRDPHEDPMVVERKAVWDYMENSDIAWGSSIGFGYHKGDEHDHLFERIWKVETSLLPLDKAANSLTPSFIIGGKPMSEAVKEERRNLWQKLVGQKPASEIEAALEGVKAALDASGLERKEFDAAKVKGLLEDTHEAIAAKIGELTDDAEKVDAITNYIISELMGTATEIADETMPMEEMQDGEDEEDMPVAMMELAEQVKALATEAQDVQEENKELIKAFIDISGIVKEQATKEAERLETVNNIVTRLEAVEKMMALTPRAASSAKETAVENAAVKNELDKGLRGQKMQLGAAVKE